MKLVVKNKSVNGVLRWTQRFLFTAGALLLGYCAFVTVDAWRFQRKAKQKLESMLKTMPAIPASLPRIRPINVPAIGPDGLIGRIEIPRLNLSVMVVEGTDKATLRRAAGHIIGTAFPGLLGNVGIAAHRDTFFRPLRNILPADIITLTTLRGEFRYRVVSLRVVRPSDVEVLNPDGHEVLTLVTCYPFYFVGPAPSRFIVRAERIT